MATKEPLNCVTCRYYDQNSPTAMYWPCNICFAHDKHRTKDLGFTDEPGVIKLYGDQGEFVPYKGEEVVLSDEMRGVDTETQTVSGIKDSGTRTEFDTGAVRDGRTDKGRFDLLPILSMFRLAKHYERGCLKYGDRNWEKGIPISKYVDSAIRHIFKYLLGMTDEHHLASAMWNVAGAMETLDRIELGILPSDLDDLPYSFADISMEKIEALLDKLL